MDAQGALDSLLGRLTTVLVNEAQLLGGIRGDVEFIKDEMECMNSLIVHLTEAQHRNHQVRTWMKQVVGLTRDCGGNVELYIHYVGGGPRVKGVLRYLRRVPFILRTIGVRHRIATRIQELKVRARDVGDRRLRYGVTVPSTEQCPYRITVVDRPALEPGSLEEEEQLQRRELLDDSHPENVIVEMVLDELWRDWKDDVDTWPIVMGIPNNGLITGIARSVYDHPSVVSSFQHRAFVDLRTTDCTQGIDELCRKIVEQLPVPPTTLRLKEDEAILETRDGMLPCLRKLTEHLEGTKFIIVLDNHRLSHKRSVETLRDFLKRSDCSPSSSLIVSMEHQDHHDIYNIILKLPNCFRKRVSALANCNVPVSDDICRLCVRDTFALQMFFRLLYVSPKWPDSEMMSLCMELGNNNFITGQIMLRFCYKDLPSNHKSCLLYLSIFPQHHKIRRTSLLRRWVAEGLVSQRSNPRLKDKATQGISTADDEAEHIFDALVTRGFLHPEETNAAGKVKTFTVPTIIYKFIVGDLSYMETCLPPDLAHRLSINNGVQIQEATCSDRPFDDVLTLLDQITGTVPWQLLKVLDLEGCRGLTKKHLENICQILLLKYLSLRDTDVKELPKKIEKLQCLETLDIRQTTMVQAFSTKAIKLPMLKYFLAGHRDSSGNSFSKFKDPFTTVCIPKGIRRMEKLQVLSYVEVSENVDDLKDIGLLPLRKLGVMLHHYKSSLSDLFQQVEKLHGCLRSLSIWIKQPPKGKAPYSEAQAIAMDTPPKHLQSLKISGITSGLPLWITALDQLEEISLSKTYLVEDAMNILGKLKILRCLQLLQDSYTQCRLNFNEGEFQQLRSLVVEGSDVTNINFDTGTTPKLRTIIWFFSTMETISGLNHLHKLKKLDLHGDCSLNQVKEAIQSHPNHPALKHNPSYQPQEDRTAAVALSASAA